MLLVQAGVAWALPADIDPGQVYRTVWSMRQGAPPSAGQLTQTRDGYLWIGAGSGLTRFDGVRFRKLADILGNGESLLSPGVTALLPDPAGGLWVGYQFGGVSLLRDGHLQHFPRGPDMMPSAVRKLVLDRAGMMWVATSRGLWQLDRGRWRAVALPEAAARAVSSIVEDARGDLWLGTDAGVYRRPAGASAFAPVPLPGLGSPVVLRDPQGRAWISDSEARRFGRLPAPGESPELVQRTWGKLPRGDLDPYFGPDGSLWYSDEIGILRFVHPERAGDAPVTPFPPGTTPDVSRLFEDREGNVWITSSEGLVRYRISKLSTVPLPPRSSYVSIAPGASGEIWSTVGIYGLMRIDGKGAPVHIDDPRTTQILDRAYPDDRGRVWFGGRDGFWCLEDGRIRDVPMPAGVGRRNGGLPSDVIQGFTIDATGALWLSVVRRAVYRYANGRWEQPAGVPGWTNPMSMATDAEGHVWLGYPNDVLVRIDSAAPGHVVEIHGLAVGNLMALTPRGDRLWIGGDAGIAMLDRQGLHTFAAKAPGALVGASGLVQARSGDLWLNGVNGISQFPVAEVDAALRDPTHPMQGVRYDYLDGMSGEPPMMRPLPTLVEGSDGRLWFSASNGLAVLDPARIFHNPLAPPVVIEGVQSRGRSIPATQGLTLPVHTTELRIAYTALSLGIPERVAFRYRLQGVDADWQDSGGRREASYTQLSPGDYLFEVRASNDDGVWNNEGASLRFRIEPAFYQTRWFAALCMLAVLAGLWGLHRLRLRQASERVHNRLEARLAERERIARELHDTLLQGFHGLMLRFQTATERIPKELAARGLMESALDRADAVLIEGRHRLLDLRREDQPPLGPALAEAGEALAVQPSAEFRLVEVGPARALRPDIGDAFLRIGTESLANAFKHARARHIEAELTYGADQLRLRVRDDGLGMAVEVLAAGQRPGHWGLTGMRERAEQVGAVLTLWSRPGAGTELELRLPAARAYRDDTTPRRFRKGRAKENQT